MIGCFALASTFTVLAFLVDTSCASLAQCVQSTRELPIMMLVLCGGRFTVSVDTALAMKGTCTMMYRYYVNPYEIMILTALFFHQQMFVARVVSPEFKILPAEYYCSNYNNSIILQAMENAGFFQNS
jgi:hypothetical protein